MMPMAIMRAESLIEIHARKLDQEQNQGGQKELHHHNNQRQNLRGKMFRKQKTQTAARANQGTRQPDDERGSADSRRGRVVVDEKAGHADAGKSDGGAPKSAQQFVRSNGFADTDHHLLMMSYRRLKASIYAGISRNQRLFPTGHEQPGPVYFFDATPTCFSLRYSRIWVTDSATVDWSVWM